MGYLLGIGKKNDEYLLRSGGANHDLPHKVSRVSLSKTDVETLKVHVQVGELSRSSSPAVYSLPPPLDLERETTVVPHLLLHFSSSLIPLSLASAPPTPSPSEAELVEVLALCSSNPRFNSVSKTTFFFFPFPSRRNRNEWT